MIPPPLHPPRGGRTVSHVPPLASYPPTTWSSVSRIGTRGGTGKFSKIKIHEIFFFLIIPIHLADCDHGKKFRKKITLNLSILRSQRQIYGLLAFFVSVFTNATSIFS